MCITRGTIVLVSKDQVQNCFQYKESLDFVFLRSSCANIIKLFMRLSSLDKQEACVDFRQ